MMKNVKIIQNNNFPTQLLLALYMYNVTYTFSSYTIHTSIYCIFMLFIKFSYITTQIKNISVFFCCFVIFLCVLIVEHKKF